jgi:ATP-binding cassette subfamily G (WHITE) protein 1
VAVITYWIIGFRPGFDHFLIYLLFLILLSLCGFALGLFCASLFENIAVGLALATLALLPLIIYGGFFVNASNSPVWIAWIQWISMVQYAFTGLIKNELGAGRVIQGVPGEYQLDLIGASSRLPMAINIIFRSCLNRKLILQLLLSSSS